MAATASPPRPQRRTSSWAGHVCPVDPAHGTLIAEHAGGLWRCPHVDHDGRPRTHPAGPSAPTRSRFTTAELESARAAQEVAS